MDWLRCSFHAAQNVVIRRDVLTKHESRWDAGKSSTTG